MSFRERLEAAPWAHDFFATLRRIERSYPDRPRVGDSAARDADAVTLGQDPYLAFPSCNIASATRDEEGGLRLIVKFLGLLGPQGALPLGTTDEVYGWLIERDDAFPRFLDLFNNRFLQLFFRAWADARPIAQADRPEADRFEAYIGASVGLGLPSLRDRDALSDRSKIAFAGLLGPATRSASRLRGAIAGLLGVAVEVDEFMGAFLQFDATDLSRLGGPNGRLGHDLVLGRSVFSIEDRIRLHIHAADLKEYERFLPGGASCEPLADLVFFYLGDEFDWDVELALPVTCVQPVHLGISGRIGYTSWIGQTASADGYRRDARFQPAERVDRAGQQGGKFAA